MYGPGSSLLLPHAAVWYVRHAGSIQVPDQLLHQMEVDIVVAEDPEALLPASKRPDRKSDRVVLAQTPQFRRELRPVRRIARMKIGNLVLRHAVDNPPIDPGLPTQKDAVDERVNPATQRVNVPHRLECKQRVDRVPDPDVPVEVKHDRAVRRNGAEEPRRIAAAFDLAEAQAD